MQCSRVVREKVMGLNLCVECDAGNRKAFGLDEDDDDEEPSSARLVGVSTCMLLGAIGLGLLCYVIARR